MLSQEDITAIRTRAQREWKATHQLQSKRKGRAAAPLNSGDVLALLEDHEKVRADLAYMHTLYTTTSRDRGAAVADAARSLAAMREAQFQESNAKAALYFWATVPRQAARDLLSSWPLWPLRLLWPRFNRVLASLRAEEKGERP